MANKGIELVIKEVLKDAIQKNALDFVSYLRANGITLGDSENYWEAMYEDKCVCYIWIDGTNEAPGPWTIWSDQESGGWSFWSDEEKHEYYPVDDNVKETVWANINKCANCGGDCSPGREKIFLEKNLVIYVVQQ